MGALEQAVVDLRPDAVSNTAAYTSVDRAEAERELTTAINGIALGILARAPTQLDATIIQYSTDYVFDGMGTLPRREDEVAHPLNHYDASKLAGEEVVVAAMSVVR